MIVRKTITVIWSGGTEVNAIRRYDEIGAENIREQKEQTGSDAVSRGSETESQSLEQARLSSSSYPDLDSDRRESHKY